VEAGWQQTSCIASQSSQYAFNYGLRESCNSKVALTKLFTIYGKTRTLAKTTDRQTQARLGIDANVCLFVCQVKFCFCILCIFFAVVYLYLCLRWARAMCHLACDLRLATCDYLTPLPHQPSPQLTHARSATFSMR